MNHEPPKTTNYQIDLTYTGGGIIPPSNDVDIIPNIITLDYTNTDLDYIPQYNKTYNLVNTNGEDRSAIITRYSGPVPLSRPSYLAYDVSNNLYGTNESLNSIYNVDLSTGTLTNIFYFSSTNTAIVITDEPLAIAISPIIPTALYVAVETFVSSSQSIYSIKKLNLTSRRLFDVVVSGAFLTSLSGLVFDSSGNLYSCDVISNNIFRIDITSENTLSNGELIGPGTATTTIIASSFAGINSPRDITIDRYNNLYVCNSGNNSILKIDPSYNVTILSNESNIINPYGISYNYLNDFIYVANFGVIGVDYNPSSNPLYVTRIANGITSNYFLDAYTSTQGSYYYSIATDLSGNIVVMASQTNELGSTSAEQEIISIYDTYTAIGMPGKFTGGQSSSSSQILTYYITPITSVALDAAETFLYAAEYRSPFPSEYPFDLSYNSYPYGIIWKISTATPTNAPTIFYPTFSGGTTSDISLNNPTSIAFDNAGNLYVSNSIDNKLIIINNVSVGTQVIITGKQLDGPTGISFDSTGNMYLVNYNDNTLCKLVFATTTTATSTQISITEVQLNRPCGTAFNNDYTTLFILNQGGNNVVALDIATSTAEIYTNLDTFTDLASPSGIVYDNNTGILYISNTGTNQLCAITNNGNINTISITYGNSVNHPYSTLTMNSPQGLVVDSNSNLYIANYGNTIDAILKVTYDPSNNTLFDSTINGINSSRLLAFDNQSGRMYILTSVDDYLPVVTNDNTIIRYGQDNLSNGQFGFVRAFGLRTQTYSGYEPYGPFIALYVQGTDFNPSVSTSNIWSIIPDQSDPNDTSVWTLRPVTITGYTIPTPSGLDDYLPYLKFGTGYPEYSTPLYYLTLPNTGKVLSLEFTDNITATARELPISGFIPNFAPEVPLFHNTESIMYLVGKTSRNGNTYYIYRIPNYNASPSPSDLPAVLLTTITTSVVGSPGHSVLDNLNFIYLNNNLIWYRITDNNGTATTEELSYLGYTEYTDIRDAVYNSIDNSIVVIARLGGVLQKIPLSFNFITSNYGLQPFENNLVVKETSSLVVNTFVFSFDIYSTFIAVNPSNPVPNVLTKNAFYFVTTPSVDSTDQSTPVYPAPCDSYYLQCNGINISNIFCNNCTFNNSKFLAGTYPTAIVISPYSYYTYVGLQNNTISRINPEGVVENNYIGTTYGLQDIISLALDASFNMYVLNKNSKNTNSLGGYITKITLENEVISAVNIVTGIASPIDMIFDTTTNLYLYVLSGDTPDVRIVRYTLSSPQTSALTLPIPFGFIYDPQGICITENVPGETIMYITNTTQTNVYQVAQLYLTTYRNIPQYTFNNIATLAYKGYRIVTKNDGKLYISNKSNNSIMVIYIPDVVYPPVVEYAVPWANINIDAPIDMDFDPSGNLYVANSGTSPRNSRISKIYLDYFYFTNVNLTTSQCVNTSIYNKTTNSNVIINYPNSSTNYNFEWPLPDPPPHTFTDPP